MRLWLPLAVGLALLAAGCSGHEGGRVAVPQTALASFPDAVRSLDEAGLRVSVPYVPPIRLVPWESGLSQLDQWTVLRQSPPAGATVRKGDAVTLSLTAAQSFGAIPGYVMPDSNPPSTVPELVGEPYRRALDAGTRVPGLWILADRVAPVVRASAGDLLRVVAQHPAAETIVPSNGARPHCRCVDPRVSSVYIELAAPGTTSAQADAASRRAATRAQAALRAASRIDAERFGGRFPSTAIRRDCHIAHLTWTPYQDNGECWTAVDLGPRDATVVYLERWHDRAFRAGTLRPWFTHTWLVHLDRRGRVTSTEESGAPVPS